MCKSKFRELSCGFHSHIDYSLDSGSTAAAKVAWAASLGRPADCVTDHGLMSGLADHWLAAQKAGIMSIHGIEAYIIDPHRPVHVQKNGKKIPQYYHQTIHFKTQKAYEYFCRLTPLMEQRGIVKFGEKKPLMTFEELEAISGDITLGSGCFLPGTKVPTDKGVKNIEDVVGGDYVLSRGGKKQKVNFSTKNLYSGDIYNISITGCLEPISATADHLFAVHTFYDRIEWKRADELSINDILVQVSEKEPDLFEDKFIFNYTSPKEKFNKCVEIDFSDPETMWIIGLYLAEGSVNHNGKKQINFSLHSEEVNYKNRIEKWAKSTADANCYIRKKESSLGVDVIINSKALTMAFLELFGKTTAANKKIPSICKNQPSDRLRHLVRGYFDGDGHYRWADTKDKKGVVYKQRSITAASISRQLIEDMAEIINKVGVNYTAHTKKWSKRKGTVRQESYSIRMNGREAMSLYKWLDNKVHISISDSESGYCKIREISKTLYTGEVHCLNMPEENSNFCLSFGILVHNCLIGPVQKNILNGNSKLAEKMYCYLRDIAGPGNFFAEVFPHIIDHNWKRPVWDQAKKNIIKEGFFEPITEMSRWPEDAIDPKPEVDPCTGTIDIQKSPNLFILEMAQKYGDPVVISLDDHYAKPEDEIVQRMRMGNSLEAWRFYGDYSSKTSDDCAKMLKQQFGATDKQIEGWIDNSYQFVENFKDYKFATNHDRALLPNVEMIYGDKFVNMTSKQVFWVLQEKHKRLPGVDHPDRKKYIDRVNYELDVLADNGMHDFLPYVFLIEDVTDFARKNNILVAARGSAGGSLVLYLLGISLADPIKYGLPFERFITLGRIKSMTLPDIDTDWPNKMVIYEYLLEKYGEKTALIATNMTMKLKNCIRDAERAVNGKVSEVTEKLAVRLPVPLGEDAVKWLYGYEDSDGNNHPGFLDDESDKIAMELRDYIASNPEIWNMVIKSLGITKNRGIHAGGVIIAPKAVSEYMPVIETKDGHLATAYAMNEVEYVGGVKYDFLGLNTLEALSVTLKSIKEVEGIDVPWGEMPHDENVYKEIIEKDKLAAIFQINTRSVSPFVKKILPKNIEQIAGLTALVRPGALDADAPDPNVKDMTAAEYYTECARGLRKPYYIHQDLESILGITHGVMIFQEQAMAVFMKMIPGYDWEKAEAVRRGIGKKKKEVLEQEGGKLIDACIDKGWSRSQAEAIFSTIMASSRYSFNKSHAIQYAIIAYNCCYLKHHYPAHFWKGMLSIYIDKHDKLKACMEEAREYLLPISVLKSHATEWLVEGTAHGQKLRPPLQLIKGCGSKGVEKLKEMIGDMQREMA